MDATTTPTNQEVVARGTDSTFLPEYRPRAIGYLRVSTEDQAKTDRGGEGYSIAAQREACLKKAEALEADIVDVYADAGESARSQDRPKLQEMLERLKTDRDIDYVIVHKIDRLARNRMDDATITLAIREAGARLVSVTENIDDSIGNAHARHHVLDCRILLSQFGDGDQEGHAQEGRERQLPWQGPDWLCESSGPQLQQ
jgi:predicted site-specific integrase-resolvase